MQSRHRRFDLNCYCCFWWMRKQFLDIGQWGGYNITNKHALPISLWSIMLPLEWSKPLSSTENDICPKKSEKKYHEDSKEELLLFCCCCSVNKLSDSLQPIELHLTRLPCPSPSPRVCSNSCPLSQWCHPNISSSGAPFSSCLQFFPASRSFPMSQLFTSGDQNIGEGNGKPLQYSCLLRTPWMNILKKTKQKLIQSWFPWI